MICLIPPRCKLLPILAVRLDYGTYWERPCNFLKKRSPARASFFLHNTGPATSTKREFITVQYEHTWEGTLLLAPDTGTLLYEENNMLAEIYMQARNLTKFQQADKLVKLTQPSPSKTPRLGQHPRALLLELYFTHTVSLPDQAPCVVYSSTDSIDQHDVVGSK